MDRRPLDTAPQDHFSFNQPFQFHGSCQPFQFQQTISVSGGIYQPFQFPPKDTPEDPRMILPLRTLSQLIYNCNICNYGWDDDGDFTPLETK